MLAVARGFVRSERTQVTPARSVEMLAIPSEIVAPSRTFVKLALEGVEKVREEIAILREGQELVDLAQEA